MVEEIKDIQARIGDDREAAIDKSIKNARQRIIELDIALGAEKAILDYLLTL